MSYAPWIKRLAAQFLDMLVAVPFIGLLLAGQGALGGAAAVVWSVSVIVAYGATTFYNRCVTMGRTGWSWGKMLVSIRVVDEHSGRPIGIPKMIVREFVHTVDMITVIGMMLPFFPRWDRKGQLLGDKIMRTVVVNQAWAGAATARRG